MSVHTESFQGYVRELNHSLKSESGSVHYELSIGGTTLNMNDLIGQQVTVAATGRKACIHCGRRVNKLFHSGYCYPCFTTLAECDLCIVKPHECHFHAGTCRDESFAESNCMIPHYVYLAYSSSVKVGLTRKGRQLTRWVDQGAIRAILLAELPTRKEAGELEMEIAQFMPDKTDWRKMLRHSDENVDVDMNALKSEVMERVSEPRRAFLLRDNSHVYQFRYPVMQGSEYPIKSISFDKTPEITGHFLGIKGQYLLLDVGVLNVKKHGGYELSLTVVS